jgi:hypothetical protein
MLRRNLPVPSGISNRDQNLNIDPGDLGAEAASPEAQRNNNAGEPNADTAGGSKDPEVPSENAATDGGSWQDTLTASRKPVAVQPD